ncbi:hypothetical protein ABPG77_001076 [Micractinium sp. CCAP 211/92]
MQEVEMDEVRRLREAYDNVCDERDEYLRQLEEQKLLVASLQEENQTLKSQLQASTSTSSCSQETAAPQQRCAEMERAVVLWQGACFVAQREAADAVRRSEAVECSTTQASRPSRLLWQECMGRHARAGPWGMLLLNAKR